MVGLFSLFRSLGKICGMGKNGKAILIVILPILEIVIGAKIFGFRS
jgi:hypothetical protein